MMNSAAKLQQNGNNSYDFILRKILAEKSFLL